MPQKKSESSDKKITRADEDAKKSARVVKNSRSSHSDEPEKDSVAKTSPKKTEAKSIKKSSGASLRVKKTAPENEKSRTAPRSPAAKKSSDSAAAKSTDSPGAKNTASSPIIQKKVRVVLKKRPLNSNRSATGATTNRQSRPQFTKDREVNRTQSDGRMQGRYRNSPRNDQGGRTRPYQRTNAFGRDALPPLDAAKDSLGSSFRDQNRDRYQNRKGASSKHYGSRGDKGFSANAAGSRQQREYNYKEFVERRKREEYREGRGQGAGDGTSHVANPIPKSINLVEGATVNELARKMNIKGGVLVSKLLSMGIMAGLNEKIDADTTILLAGEYGCEVNFISLYDETVLPQIAEEELVYESRPPVVTIMGHVDHGKTTLLDTIRKSNIVESESGKITQHIAAYQITNKDQTITFIDTPGHEAFTLMRARGAHLTDIVVLVVAADDGLMPQTKEAVDHAKEANVPIIVAINKCDLETSNIEQTKQQLSSYGLVPEEWGGDIICCPISALKGDGIPDLLDAILVRAEELSLKAPTNGRAEGKILESRVDHGRGIVCTVLIQRGVLNTGDNFLAGIYMGKVRAMFDDNGRRVSSAGASTPVEVLGFDAIPNAGDPFQVANSEKEARMIGGRRQELEKIKSAREVKTVDADSIYSSIEHHAQDSYKIVLKGDVDGSVEAIKTAIERFRDEKVRVDVILSAVGDINSNDVLLASASNAIIIGFHVRISASIQRLADQEGVKIKKYTIIYKVLEDLEEYLLGLKQPEYNEVEIGMGEIRAIFSVSKIGKIAGSFINKGKIKRDCIIELSRDGKQMHRGKINGLKRFKNDAKEVDAGYECGVTIDSFSDFKEGDTFRVLEKQEIA